MLGNLTLDQLRILVTIGETGSFSAAGRKIKRAQSAISQSVRTLEEMQGVQIFDRSSKTPTLTEAGQILLTQARQVLRQAERFEGIAGSIASGLEPELNLAVDSFIPTAPIIESLRALKDAFPDLQVTLYTEGLWAAERRVRNGTATLGLCAMLPATAQDLQAHPLMSMPLLPVVAASHPLATETRPITRDILQDHIQLVLTDPENPGGPSYSVVSVRIWRFVELGRRLDFILAGFGWATMPAHIVAPHLAGGRLVELDIQDPGVTSGSIPIYAVHERSRPPRKATRWLLDDLRERLREPD